MKRMFKRFPVTAAKMDEYDAVHDKVEGYIESLLVDKIEDALAPKVADIIASYNLDWAAQDPYGPDHDACEAARLQYAKALTDSLMVNYRKES